MPNPRSGVGGSDSRYIRKTYKADSTIVYSKDATNGHAMAGRGSVTMQGKADDTMGLCADGEKVDGRLEIVESDGRIVVTISGEMTFPGGASATLTVGEPIVGAVDGSANRGFIRNPVAPTTTAATAVQLAELRRARGAIKNNDDTTAVLVDLRV